MTKSRLFYLCSLVCLLIVLSFILITSIHVDGLIEEHNNTDYSNDEIGESIGNALSLAIVKILVIMCGIVYILPTLLKLVAVIVNGRLAGIISLIFDAIFSVLSLMLTLTALINSGGNIDFSTVFLIGIATFNLAALVLCCIALKFTAVPTANITESIPTDEAVS